jgi:molybdopterin converting factor subunit 1
MDLNVKHIKLLFFATIRDKVGVRSLELDVPIDMTVKTLKDRLSEEYPVLRGSMKSILIAVNHEYAFDEVVLPPGAEIALFPPVSGG